MLALGSACRIWCCTESACSNSMALRVKQLSQLAASNQWLARYQELAQPAASLLRPSSVCAPTTSYTSTTTSTVPACSIWWSSVSSPIISGATAPRAALGQHQLTLWACARWFSSTSGLHPEDGPGIPAVPVPKPDIASFTSEEAGSAQAPATITITLADALARLVDTAVDLVGNNSLPEAINVLKEGITTLEPKFPNSAEIGELYNQVALLLYFQNACDEAAEHAQIALDITRDCFGADSKLTAHRMLRLATCKFGQDKLAEASRLLEECLAVLGDDPSHLEGAFYRVLVHLAEITDDAAEVAMLTEPLLDILHKMKAADGSDNMVVTLMLAQHNRLLCVALERRAVVGLSEALFRQHISLLGAVQTDTEELGITHYKLATLYYAHHMLGDGSAAIHKAMSIMRMHYPEEHDLVVLCQHRMGMLCAAAGDHRSASRLLAQSCERYTQKPETKGLAVEAEAGLALARWHAAASNTDREVALRDMERLIAELATGVGCNHMLVAGAHNYYSKAMATQQARSRR